MSFFQGDLAKKVQRSGIKTAPDKNENLIKNVVNCKTSKGSI